MTNRILDFDAEPAFLSTRNGLLLITRQGKPEETVPLSDIAVVVASNRQVVFTQNLLASMAQAGAILICSDARHHPAAMMLPLESHHAQAERFQAQSAAPLPLRKRIWQELVQAKIRAQASTLARLHGDGAGLDQLARRVRSGDAGNQEAIAAQRYWPRLFGDRGFRRSNESDQRNGILNYGYAILRGITARAVCAAGLHPSLGVSHHNRYNPFCLADDLMEPLRPLVDYQTVSICRDVGSGRPEINKTTKLLLLAFLTGRFTVAGERRTLFDIVARRASQLASLYLRQEKRFVWEDVCFGS